MKKIALALCVSSALFGADYKYELTPVIGYAHSEGTYGIDDQKFLGLRIARNLDTLLLSQIELGFDFSKDVTYENLSGVDTDLTRYYLNFVRDFPLFGDLSGYGLLGAGYQYLSHEANDIDSTGFGQFGLGLKYKITDNFSLKAEARDAIDFKQGDNTFLYSLGFVVAFGGKSAQTPTQVKEEPKQEIQAAPEEPVKKMIRLNLHANFGFDSATITPQYRAKIEEVANVMKQNSEYSVVLEGHTDSLGSAEYNKKLSLKRANAVAKVLMEMGVSKDRITAVGFGEERPIASNDTEEGRAQNRRVDANFNTAK